MAGKDIIVAGAGIVGVSTALWLQRSGHRVRLVDRQGPAAGTSHGNAGVLAAAAIAPVNAPGLLPKVPGMVLDPMQPLFLRWPYLPRALPFLSRFVAKGSKTHVAHYAKNMAMLMHDTYDQHLALAKGTTAEKYLGDQDYCFGFQTEDEFRGEAASFEFKRAHGYEVEILSGADYAERDPMFQGCFAKVAVCKNHGRVSDPGAYVKALADHFVDQGGELILATVDDVEMEGSRCSALLTSEGPLKADHIVLCLGAWSAPLARKLGARDLSFETERGYHIELVNPSIMPKAPMMVNAGKFVFSPMDGRLRCAGVVEFGGLEAGPSRAPFDMIRRYIAQIMPDLRWEDEVEWMGHRPTSSDFIPLIGPVTKDASAFLAFGHQHLGLTAGPKTGRLIAAMIDQQPINQDLSAFDPLRFR